MSYIIQFVFSESSMHFFRHIFSSLHVAGACQFSEHLKQNDFPQSHVTDFSSSEFASIAFVQSGAGHHLIKRLLATNVFKTRREYLSFNSFASSLTIVKLSTKQQHKGVGQYILEQSPESTYNLKQKNM